MELFNSFDSAAFVNHLAAPAPALERDLDDAVRASGLGSSRMTREDTAALVFPRDAWIRSWAVAPF
ncbi:MAG: hypothetical protein GX430_07560 [Treponema sp.]|nr:hypothetical protein [Treponema sp.]